MIKDLQAHNALTLERMLEKQINDLEIDMRQAQDNPTIHAYIRGERAAYLSIYKWITDCPLGLLDHTWAENAAVETKLTPEEYNKREIPNV